MVEALVHEFYGQVPPPIRCWRRCVRSAKADWEPTSCARWCGSESFGGADAGAITGRRWSSICRSVDAIILDRWLALFDRPARDNLSTSA